MKSTLLFGGVSPKSNLINSEKISRIYLCLFFLVFLCINTLTPFNQDDYFYSFNLATNEFIGGIIDVIQSQYTHYLIKNGRIIPHIFEQIFAGITGKWLFDILNSVASVLLIHLVTNCIIRRLPQLKTCRNFLLNITFFASLLLFSYPGQSMFWMAGGLNYLWPTVLAIVLLNLFEFPNRYKCWGLGIFALIAGWFQEAISIPLCASLWIYILIDKQFRNKRSFAIAIGYTIGTCLIVFSPGTMQRLSSGELHHDGGLLFIVVSKTLETLACFRSLHVYWISLVLIIVYAIFGKFNIFKEYRNWMILWGINSLFFLALGFPHERITLFLSVLSFVISICLILSKVKVKYFAFVNYSILIIVLLNVITACYSIDVCRLHHSWDNKLVETVKTSSTPHVVVEMNPYEVQSRLIYSQYIVDGHHVAFARYLGKLSAQFLDSEFYQKLSKVDFNKESQNFLLSKDSKYRLDHSDDIYFVKLPSFYFDERINIKTYHPIKQENLSRRQLFIRRILGTLDHGISSINYYLFYKDANECVCVIPKIPSSEETLVITRKDNSEICSFELKQ